MNTVYLLILIITIIFGTIIITIHNSKDTRVGIVSMMKQPHQVETWIDYHIKIGAVKLYIFIDDPNDSSIQLINEIINKKNYQDKIKVTIIDDKWKTDNNYKYNKNKDEPQNWNARQDLCVDNAFKYAKEDKIDIIIHIDSDELLYSIKKKKLNEIFNQYKNKYVFGITNYEMAPEKDDYQNCFLENTYFRMNGINYIAYGNGKSAGRTGFSKSYGPHDMTLLSGIGTKQEINEEYLVVLHFVSCNLNETIKKYKMYGNFSNEKWDWAKFHLEARDTLKECDKDCLEKAKKLFQSRFKKDGDKIIQINIKTILSE